MSMDWVRKRRSDSSLIRDGVEGRKSRRWRRDAVARWGEKSCTRTGCGARISGAVLQHPLNRPHPKIRRQILMNELEWTWIVSVEGYSHYKNGFGLAGDRVLRRKLKVCRD
jgi:hypothetical protein